MRQYDRAWSLTFERQDPKTNAVTVLGVIQNLRLSFRVTKYIGSVGDTSQIRVYNLPASLRAAVARVPDFDNGLISPPYDFVTLRAGYIDGNPVMEIPVIARGVVFTSFNRRIGADWITDIDANGFLGQSVGATKEKCYDGVPAIFVVGDILDSMGIGVPDMSVKARQVLGDEIIYWAISGNGNTELRRLLDALGLVFAVESNKVFIMSKTEGEATPRDPPYVYAEETGLIGVPEISKQGVKIRALLNTKTRLLSRFDVQSVSLEATLKKTIHSFLSFNITYNGDTRGSNWYVEIDGVYPRLWRSVAERDGIIRPPA